MERFLLSNLFRGSFALLGSVFAIVFGFNEDWVLSTAVVIACAGLISASWMLRFMSKQLRRRYQEQVQRSREWVQEQLQRGREAVESLHRYIQVTRDGAIRLMQAQAGVMKELAADGDLATWWTVSSQLRDDFFRKILEELVRVVTPLVPVDAKLWAAIRIIAADDDGKNYYKTLVRAGAVDYAARERLSERVHENAGFPHHLRQQYRIGKGVVVLGKDRPLEIWKPQPADDRKEDQSLIAAPIVLESNENAQMTMILYLCSPSEDVFDSSHEPYMKCCAGVLSLYLAMIFTQIPEIRPRGGTETGARRK